MLDKLKGLVGYKTKNKSSGSPNEDMGGENSRQTSAPHSNNNLEAGSIASDGSRSERPSPSQSGDQRASGEASHRARSERPYEASDTNPHDKGTSFRRPDPIMTENQLREKAGMSVSMRSYLCQTPEEEPFNSRLASGGFQGEPAVTPSRAERSRSQDPPSSTGARPGSATDSANQ